MRISDFFNRIPSVALIPAVMLLALGIAAFLIWVGIKLSPVVIKEEGAITEERKKEKGKKNNTPAGEEENGFWGESPFGGKVNGLRDTGSDLGLETGGGTAGVNGGTENSGGQTDQNNQNAVSNTAGSSLSYGDEGEGGTGAQAGSSYYGKNRNSNKSVSGSGNASKRCTYPAGDINVWWHNATQRQKNCYISQHGLPDLSSKVPYFCGYDNSEDCYYR